MWKLVAALVVSSLVASGSALAQPKSAKGGYDQLNLFGEAFDRIRQDAVEPVGDTKLVGAAIAGMLSGFSAIAVQAQARGELGPNFDVSELTAAIAGPLFYRRWFSRQELDDAFVRGVVERALGWSK